MIMICPFEYVSNCAKKKKKKALKIFNQPNRFMEPCNIATAKPGAMPSFESETCKLM
jgi:hypothetical protein